MDYEKLLQQLEDEALRIRNALGEAENRVVELSNGFQRALGALELARKLQAEAEKPEPTSGEAAEE